MRSLKTWAVVIGLLCIAPEILEGTSGTSSGEVALAFMCASGFLIIFAAMTNLAAKRKWTIVTAIVLATLGGIFTYAGVIAPDLPLPAIVIGILMSLLCLGVSLLLLIFDDQYRILG
jgi:hypothetical protein